MLVTFPFNSALSHVYNWCFIEEIYYSYVWKLEMDSATKRSQKSDIIVLYKKQIFKTKTKINA